MRYTLWGLYQYRPTLFDNIQLPDQCDHDILVDVILEKSGMLYPAHQVPERFDRNIHNWFARMKPGFARMFDALEAEYSPVENYDRKEEWTDSPDITRTMSGGHTNNNTKTGSYQDTLRKSGIVRETLDKSGSEKLSEEWGGGHKNVYDSDENTESQNKVSAYNSPAYEPESQQIGDRTSSGSDIFSYQGEFKDSNTTFQDRNDTRVTNWQDYKEEHTIFRPEPGEKDNDVFTYQNEAQHEIGTTTHTGRMHGNIGVTTAQAMITEELNLRRYDIYETIAGMFEDEFMSQVY